MKQFRYFPYQGSGELFKLIGHFKSTPLSNCLPEIFQLFTISCGFPLNFEKAASFIKTGNIFTRPRIRSNVQEIWHN